jgi:hypothetical protein
MDVRAAEKGEIDHLARLWYDGWHEAHAQIQLTRLRTLESFRDRLHAALPNVRVSVRLASSLVSASFREGLPRSRGYGNPSSRCLANWIFPCQRDGAIARNRVNDLLASSWLPRV